MTQLCLSYPVDLSPDAGGRIVARVSDVAGCVTDGSDRAEALTEAADALEEALAAAMTGREEIPLPGSFNDRPLVSPGAVMAAKVALYIAMRESKATNVSLATRLGCAESEVRRMLDPKHPTKIGRLEQALAVFGRRMVITVEAA